jgi:hypothetical protein
MKKIGSGVNEFFFNEGNFFYVFFVLPVSLDDRYELDFFFISSLFEVIYEFINVYICTVF